MPVASYFHVALVLLFHIFCVRAREFSECLYDPRKENPYLVCRDFKTHTVLSVLFASAAICFCSMLIPLNIVQWIYGIDP